MISVNKVVRHDHDRGLGITLGEVLVSIGIVIITAAFLRPTLYRSTCRDYILRSDGSVSFVSESDSMITVDKLPRGLVR